MKYFLLTFFNGFEHYSCRIFGSRRYNNNSIEYSDNKEEFAVKTSGGTGGCATGNWIIFKEANMSSSEALARSYSAALAAFAGGFKVNIYDYHGSDCLHAESIQLTK